MRLRAVGKFSAALLVLVLLTACNAKAQGGPTTLSATASTTTVYEIEGLVCLSETYQASTSDYPIGANGAETREAAVAQWVENEVIVPDPKALTQTESSSGKIIFVDDADRPQIVVDVLDNGNGWLVVGYRACGTE